MIMIWVFVVWIRTRRVHMWMLFTRVSFIDFRIMMFFIRVHWISWIVRFRRSWFSVRWPICMINSWFRRLTPWSIRVPRRRWWSWSCCVRWSRCRCRSCSRRVISTGWYDIPNFIFSST